MSKLITLPITEHNKNSAIPSKRSQEKRIDKTKGVVPDVLILGTRSKNGRIYSAAALKAAVSLFENSKVNLDHPEGGEVNAKRPRRFAERFGRIKNVTYVPGKGLRGDLHYNPKLSVAPAFEHWVDNDPGAIALSPNQDGKGKFNSDGLFEVAEIVKVRSVDIVADGGSTESLFEGLLADKIEERSEEGKLRIAVGAAMQLIDGTVYNSTLKYREKKKAIAEVASELANLLGNKKALASITEEDQQVESKTLTIEELKKERPDLVTAVLQEHEQSQDQKSKDEQIKTLNEQLDEERTKREILERRQLIDKKIADRKVPEKLVTEQFRRTLFEAKDEKAIDAAIDDRLILLEHAGAKSHRQDPAGNVQNGDGNVPLDRKSFVSQVKG